MTPFPRPTAEPEAAPPDARKRVRYAPGMVLGADDFEQEHAYLVGRDDRLARDAVGYGTLSGLAVTARPAPGPAGATPEVVVSPGTALTPRGRLVRVTPPQCAKLNPWLTANAEAVTKWLADHPPVAGVQPPLPVSVALTFRDCPTDPVLIPGEPCRTEDEATAASRLVDDFRLELRTGSSPYPEESAVRDFVDWLAKVTVVAGAGAPGDLDAFLAAIREAAKRPPDTPAGAPTECLYGDPAPALTLPADAAAEYLRAAFGLWVTELRPAWRTDDWDEPRPPGQLADADRERLLLADLTIPVKDGQVDPAGTVGIATARRPVVAHLRMLQEWLFRAGRAQAGAAGPLPALAGDVTGPIGGNTVQQLQGKAVPAPDDAADGKLLGYSAADGGAWVLKDPPVGPGVVPQPAADLPAAENQYTGGGPLRGLDEGRFALADHTHGTPPALTGDVTGDANGVTTVGGIAGVPVNTPDADRVDNRVLTFRAGAYVLTDPPAAGGPPAGAQPAAGPPVAENVYTGAGPDRGADDQRYALADHTHGTPPALTGDVTGDAAGGTTVGGLLGRPFAQPPALADGRVLTFQGGAWVLADPPGPAAGPQPADGPPPAETVYGGAGPARGLDAQRYALADHTHGSPPLLTGDVAGDANGVTAVGKIDGSPVAFAPATQPAPGRVLTFNGGRWGAEDLPAPPANVVTHPTAARYEIVAAGSVRLDPNAPLRSPRFNNLQVVSARQVAADTVEAVLTFDNLRVPDEGDTFQYVVKVLPWELQLQEQSHSLIANFSRYEAAGGGQPNRFVIRVRLTPRPANAVAVERIELMVEVSQFTRV